MEQRQRTAGKRMKRSDAGGDLVWLTGHAQEIERAFQQRSVRVYRHEDAPLCLLDAGSDRRFLADLTPGAGGIRSFRDDIGDEWKPWGGRRTEGARCPRVSVRGGDRVLVLELHWNSRVGDRLRTDLVLELGGRQTNALLVVADDQKHGEIVDVLRPVSGKVNRVRELLPGRQYAPPPTFDRMSAADSWEWSGLEGLTVEKSLTGRFLAMSVLWAQELCHRAVSYTHLRAHET